MAELPEIVRQRLGQQAGGDHPDADLLTAFAEGSLGERERIRVLAHLGACGVCREVVSLALPETPALQPAPAPVRSAWLRWPVLRWGAMAAAVVVVATAVMLREPRRAPVMDGGSIAATAKQDETAPAKPQLEDKEVHTEAKDNVIAKAKSSAPKPAGGGGMKVAEAESGKKNEKLLVGQTQPAATPVDHIQEDAALSQLQQQRAQTMPRDSVQQSARADQQAFQAGASGGIEQQRQLSMAQQAAPAPRRAQAAPPAAPSQGTQQNMVTADRAEAVAPAASTASTVDIPAKGAVMMKSSVVRVAPARWRVSDKGKVERSLDSGATWSVLPVQGGASFRAVSAVENDVWAGGAAGALYHSADGGQTWTRVVPRTAESALTSDITRVEFTDTSRGVVATASGETWITADAGRTWTARRP